MSIKVLINYDRLRPDALLIKCRDVAQKMTGNEIFPNPEPSMIDYGTLVDAFDVALMAATNGGKQEVAQKKTLQKEVLAKTKSLALYVNSIAAGNIDWLTSSGLTLSKVPQPRILGNPTNLRIMQGTNPGSLVSRVDALKGAITYDHQHTTHPLTKESVWTSVVCSRSTCEVEGLEQGKMYWFRVIAIGSKDQRTYSEETSQFVSQRTLTVAG